MKYYVNPNDIKKVCDKIVGDVDKAVMHLWEYLQTKLQEQIMIDSYDTWALARSINYQRVRKGVVEVWSNLEYALVRENWRRPWRFPPMDSIASWSARKGIISWWVTTWYDNLESSEKSKVFLIARAIATRWIEWKHTFENVVNRERVNVIKIFKDYMLWKW